MALEIERKFLLSEYPDSKIEDGSLEIISIQHIEQTYLALADGEELRVRRLRTADTHHSDYMLTYKSGYGLVKQELEHAITKQLYDELIDNVRFIPLLKDRTTARISGTDIIIEIDRYNHHPLIVVEVEFKDEHTAKSFQPPSWFGKDISTNKQYSNKEMWKQLNGVSS